MIKRTLYYESSLTPRMETHIFREFKSGDVGYLQVMYIPNKYRSFNLISKEDMKYIIQDLRNIGAYER